MRNRYRIKINELNNGKKEYIPQVGTPKLSLGKYVHINWEWENIIMDDIHKFQTSIYMTYLYKTEEKAIAVIEGYKKYLTEQEGKKVNKTRYKEL